MIKEKQSELKMADNFWDNLMGDDQGAATYMETYGEGPGSDTRNLIFKFVDEGESVLDVGCGPGWNYDHILKYATHVGEYKGKDYSERFVRVANQRHEGKFEIGDIRNFGEPDKSWDVVLLQDVLEHTNGYEKPLAEAIRVARKRIIVTFWRGQMMDDYENDNGEDMIRDDGNDGWGSEYSRKKWEQYLDGLGLHSLDVQTDEGANRWHRVYIIDLEKSNG